MLKKIFSSGLFLTTTLLATGCGNFLDSRVDPPSAPSQAVATNVAEAGKGVAHADPISGTPAKILLDSAAHTEPTMPPLRGFAELFSEGYTFYITDITGRPSYSVLEESPLDNATPQQLKDNGKIIELTSDLRHFSSEDERRIQTVCKHNCILRAMNNNILYVLAWD